MPFTTLTDWATIPVPGPSDFNTYIRDNDGYLLNGRPSPVINRVGVADYTTTSTSFVDADAVNLILTATVNSGRFRIVVTGIVTSSPGSAYLDIIVDGTTRNGDATYGLWVQPNNGGNPLTMPLVADIIGLSVGSHTFKLQWKVTSGTGTLSNNGRIIHMSGWEY